MSVNINFELRPCLVFNTKSNGKRYSKNALFHKWVDFENKYDPFEQNKVKALVEYEDGTVDTVYPSLIKFLDDKHSEYVFTDIVEESKK